tara:strand:+ start:4011 stop:8579 length:4569 start_codon:yes stop_codon:yes gene_type:complete
MALYDTITIASSGKTYTFSGIQVNDETDLKVKKEGATTNLSTPTDYTISGSQITFDAAYSVTNGDKYLIYRDTKDDAARNDFYPSGSVRAQDLNKNFEQAFMAAEDKVPQFGATFPDNIDMGGNKITGLKDIYTGVDTDQDISSMFTDSDAASIGFVKHFFFDSGAETVLSNETWQTNDTTIATTAAVVKKIDEDLAAALTTEVHSTDGISITDNTPNAGNITVGISQGSVDLDRIKPEDINTSTETVYGYANNAPTITGTDWATTDDQVATLKAIAKRHDGIVSNTAPSGTDYLPGTVWLSESGSSDTVNEEGEQLNKYLAVWNGSEWVGVAGGGTWINQNRLIWVDAGNGDDNNDGHRVISPMKTIQGAVNTAEDGDMIFVQPGVYSEYLPIDLGRKSNVSIIGLSMRSVFVHPHPTKKWVVGNTSNYAPSTNDVVNKVRENGPHGNTTADNSANTSEYETMFQLGSGSFVANMTIAGMKASGTRTDLATGTNSSAATTQGWFFAFAENDGAGNAVKFTKSPYVQNVTCFADSAIDNSNYQPHSTTNQPAFGGDQTSAITGGALLVDGNVPHADSPLRSFLTDAYTIICLDGPGVLVRNEGYAQLVSTFGHFTHYHAKAESGGMINMSNCTTDFGRFGLVADGQSSDSIFEGTVSATSTNNVIQIDATTAWSERNNNTPKPVNHMVVSLINNPSSASDFYPIKAVTEPSSGVYDIELYDNVSVTNDQTVYFYLRSTITTGGHVFEFAGAGTDYRAHPDNGGTPVEANQVINEGAGKVYISSSDHNGNFKVGDVFNVSTDGASVAVTGTSTFNGNVTVGGTLDATTLTVGGSAVNSSATYFDGSGDIKDTAMPDKVSAGTSGYPTSVTVDAQGRVTAISAGTEPVTAVSAASGSAVSVTATKTPEIDIATFAGSSQKGIVVNDGTSGNDTKFLKGDGTWADPAQAAYNISATQSSNDVDFTLGGSSSSTVKIVAGSGVNLTRNSAQEFEIAAPNTNQAAVFISNTVPTSSVDAGDMWWDKTTGESYIYYNDGDSSQWVQFAPQQRGTGNGTVTSVTAGTGLSGGTFTTTGTVALANTAVTTGTYGDADSVGQFTVDQQGRITGASNVDIALAASAVTSGSFDAARIPSLSANKITSDTLGVDRIPSLAAAKITSGTLDAARIPDLAAAKITSGTFHVDRIPTLQKSKISSTGTWNTADIPDLSATYLTDLSADSTPQLGANLDVNSYSIVSTSNGNVTLNPNGTGVVSFANNTGTTYVNGSYGVTIKPPTLTGSYSLTLPTDDGNANQLLKTNGSGVLSWVNDQDTTYSLAGANDGGDFRIRLSDSTTNDDVKLKAGTGVSLDNTVANECTISVSAVPTGAIMYWPGSSAIPSGWKECNGEILLIADYSALNTALGANTYKWQYDANNSAYTVPGGGAFNAALHFQLPDLRGEFIRGLDNSRGVDTGRGLGSAQEDNVKQHLHSVSLAANQTTYSAGSLPRSSHNTTAQGGSASTGNYPVTAGTPDETRPRNLAMKAIIKT